MEYREKKSLPATSSANFDSKVKELIEIREGVRSGWGSAFITFDELSTYDFTANMDSTTGVVVVSGGTAPAPPTNLAVSGDTLRNTLTWTISTSSDVWYYEVWVSLSQNISEATRLALVTHPNDYYVHALDAAEVLQNHYYWIRAVSWGNLYSTWEPIDQQGGFLVVGSTSYADMIADIVSVLEGQITANELYEDLNTRIDKIDVSENNLWDAVYDSETGLWQSIKRENTGLEVVSEAMQDEVNALSNSILAYINDSDDRYNRLAYERQVTDATISVDPETGEISLLATAAVSTEVEARIDVLEFNMNSDTGTIDVLAGRVTATENDITIAQGDITVLQGEVALKASTSYVDVALDTFSQVYDTDVITSLQEDIPDGLFYLILGIDENRQQSLENKTRIATANFTLTTLADELEAEATALLDLAAVVDNNYAILINEQTTRASETETLSSDVSLLWAEFDNGETGAWAAIETANTAIANLTSATAEAIETLSTTVGGHTTSIETAASSIDGIEGKYTVKIDNNGTVAGYGLISENNNGSIVSEFGVVADSFYVATPGGEEIIPFIIASVTDSPDWNDYTTYIAGAYVNHNGNYYRANTGNLNYEPPASQWDVVYGGTIVAINGMLLVQGSILGEAIGADQIRAYHIAANELVVGDNVEMGENAYIGWSNVTGTPNTTYIDQDGLYTGTIDADQIDTRGLTIKDEEGNVLFGGGTNITTDYITGLGDFAFVSELDINNISTYIANAAIGTAQIANASITQAKIAALAVAYANIANLSVGTIKIQDQAVTIPVGVCTTGALTAYASVYTSVQTATITATGAPVLVLARFLCTGYYGLGGATQSTIYILRDSTTLYQENRTFPAGYSETFEFFLMDTPTAGSHTYQIVLYGGSGGTYSATYRIICLLECKK